MEFDHHIAYSLAMTEDERAIRQVVDQWMTASKAGDLPTILNLMTDDVLFLTPGREPFGKEEFRATFESLKELAIDGQATVLEVQIAGNWAWLRNQIDLTITPVGSSAVRRSGETLTILRKALDGRWRLCRDANLVS